MLDRSHKGSELADFTFSDASGKELRLATLKGRPVLINLWATWCAPCIVELPTLDRLAGQSKVRVLTVSQDLPESAGRVAEFLARRGGTRLEPWLDTSNQLSTHFRAEIYPMTIYYDARGREVWRVSGPLEWDGAEAAKLLAEADG